MSTASHYEFLAFIAIILVYYFILFDYHIFIQIISTFYSIKY